MDLGHMITALSQLWSFSHVQCDAVLQSRHIEVLNAYSPSKSGWERDGVYFGFFWGTGWLALCLGMLILSWRRQDPTSKTGRLVLPFFLLFGLGLLCVQLQAMARYVDVCRRALGLSLAAPSYGEGTNRWLVIFIIAAFAGAWYTILTTKYREATNPLERATPAVLMILGGLFFACVGGAAIFRILH
jgi:hypothetical protein